MDQVKMWNMRRTPLAAVIFTVLYLTVTFAKHLDMAPDAVVYEYDGCHKEAMRKFIHSGLLKEELSSSAEFRKAWTTGCTDMIAGGSTEHTAALATYQDRKFSKIFNDAVETKGTNGSTYENNFPFKALHYLLMDTLRLGKKGCKNVYIMSDDDFTADKGAKIRFGRFTQVKTDPTQKEDFLGRVYFNITTCFFFDLQNFCREDEDIGLLSPSEMFTVENVRDVITVDGDEYKEIVLKHSKPQVPKDYCSTFSRSLADISTTWLVLLLVALSLLIVNC